MDYNIIKMLQGVRLDNAHFNQLIKPNKMSKYSIFATKTDYQNAYYILQKLEKQLEVELNWKKIKRTNYDNLDALIFILRKKLKTKNNQNETTN